MSSMKSFVDEMDDLTWEECKSIGSNHYKTGAIEPIDLYDSVTPHPSLNCMQIKALTDNIKYSFRMLTEGLNLGDVRKVVHSTVLAWASYRRRKPCE